MASYDLIYFMLFNYQAAVVHLQIEKYIMI